MTNNERISAGAGSCKRNTRAFFLDSLFYVFVDLKPNKEKPDFYIVPSKDAAKYVKESHADWLSQPSRTGKKHKDTDMRLFEIEDDATASKYLDKWENLGL